MIGVQIDPEDVGSTIELELVAIRVRDVVVRVTVVREDGTRELLASKMLLAAGEKVPIKGKT